MSKTAIVLHHTADPSPDPQYQKVWDYHNSGAGGKWPAGHGMQYHYFIGKDGTVKQARPEYSVGWQAGSTYWNNISIGICLAGDFTQQQPTDAQIEALAVVINDIQNRWGIQDSRVYLHKEVRPFPTACPGTDLRALAFARRTQDLTQRLDQLKQFINSVPPQRKTIMQRVIDALQNRLYGSSCPC